MVGCKIAAFLSRMPKMGRKGTSFIGAPNLYKASIDPTTICRTHCTLPSIQKVAKGFMSFVKVAVRPFFGSRCKQMGSNQPLTSISGG